MVIKAYLVFNKYKPVLPFKFPVLKESAPLRYFTFFYLYAMQGVPAGFALTALANYMIAKGASAVAIGTFDAVIGIPWVIQLIWGPVIDRFQFSVMGNRKHWVIASEIMALVMLSSLLWITNPVKQLTLVMCIFCAHSVFASIQDASVDGTAIAITPEKERGRLNAYMRLGWLFGLSLGSAGLSIVLHRFGFHVAVWIQFLSLLVLTLITYLIKINRYDRYWITTVQPVAEQTEAAQTENPNMKWLFNQLYRGIVHKNSLNVFGIIVVVYFCLDVYIRALPFQLIHYLHWNDSEWSVLQGTWGTIVSVFVLIGGGYLADRVGAKKLQYWVMVIYCVYFIVFDALGPLWVHKPVSVTGVVLYTICDPLFSVATMPTLMTLCYARVEGSQFTAYMALVNLFDVIGAYVSGWAMTITTAPVIGFICGMIILAAISVMAYQHRAKVRWYKLVQ